MNRFVFLVAAALALASPAVAQHGHGAHPGAAHDMTIQLSIPDGAVLTTAPSELRIAFKPAMRLKSVRLETAAGERIPVTFDDTQVSEAAVVRFDPLAPDAYTLSFNADAGDHDMPGRIRFTVR